MSKQELKQKGFTIIEVVLVLAIAALIFLMVFIALPALQRNQKDQARRTVMGKVASAVTTYQSNRRSQQPTTGALLAPYADGVAAAGGTNGSLENGSYTLVVSAWAAGATVGAANQSTIQVYTGAKCDPTGAFALCFCVQAIQHDFQCSGKGFACLSCKHTDFETAVVGKPFFLIRIKY